MFRSFSRVLFLLLLFPAAVFSAEPDEEQLYEPYAESLGAYVNENGRVNYAGLKADCQSLRAFLSRVETLSRDEYLGWKESAQIALWLNVYNALTLKLVVDNYPIEGGFFSSFFSPSNSVRHIKGGQDKLNFTVMGQRWTLQQIEDEILRKQFREPRIHFALVDAARSSPPLRREPYTSAKLSSQLEDQTRAFLSVPGNFTLDRQRKAVELSELFELYGDDFVAAYGSNLKDGSRQVKEQAAVNFVAQYVTDSEKKILHDPELSVSFRDFEWNLNEQ